MLMDLKQAMKAGDSVPITLVFEDAAKKRFTQSLSVPIRALGAGNEMKNEKGHAHKH
jgi:copper(I)-binding protein